VSDFSGKMIALLSSLRRLRQLLPLAFVVAGLLAAPSSAQEISGAERTQLEAQKATLFQQMLRDPANLDTAFAYADVSAKLGDNEAAVSALERMLLFNPNLPRVQLELGTLYFRMGSFEIARTYFERAAAANPPEEVRERIETYLGQISRQSAPQRFSGSFSTGVQYQSNANLAGSSNILGVNVLPQFVKRSDVNVFATGSVLYSYDLGTQTRDALEATGIGFVNHHSSVTRLDLGLVEATAGPRFIFPEPLPRVSVVSLKPYLIANDVVLGGNQYFHTLGAGGEATALAWGDVQLKSVFEFRQKNFNDAPDRPLSRGFNGSDKVVTLAVNKPITAVPQSDLTLEFGFLNQDTRLPYYSNNTYAGYAAYHIRYDDPTGILRLPLDTTVFLSRSWAYYAAPDPCCGAVRFERHWRFGIAQSFPVTRDIAVVVQLQRDVVSSLPLYNYTSNSVVVGPRIQF
jgi:hypothetical protein